MNFKLEELTKDNEAQYLEQVANLEQVVMENMEARGQSGQLFPTGREDISAYAHSKKIRFLLQLMKMARLLLQHILHKDNNRLRTMTSRNILNMEMIIINT